MLRITQLFHIRNAKLLLFAILGSVLNRTSGLFTIGFVTIISDSRYALFLDGIGA